MLKSILFRPCSVSLTEGEAPLNDEEDAKANVSNRLLFAHQTAWKRRLMLRYWNKITFLDATYKITRYDLPLFFLVVKTNINYAVVGFFVIQNEPAIVVTESLQRFLKWNPGWKP